MNTKSFVSITDWPFLKKKSVMSNCTLHTVPSHDRNGRNKKMLRQFLDGAIVTIYVSLIARNRWQFNMCDIFLSHYVYILSSSESRPDITEISLSLSRHQSLSSITPVRPFKLHPASAKCWCKSLLVGQH